jgi:diguanylate cyclase
MTVKDNEKAHILIIDDEPSVRTFLSDFLSEDYLCATAESAESALLLLQNREFDLVISDIYLGGISGIEMIPKVFELAPDTVVMMTSGDQTIDRAIEAMRVGAVDYIKKPFDLAQIQTAARAALEHRSLLAAKRRYESFVEELLAQRTAQIEYLSYHDPLTGLPNRALFEDRLSQALIYGRETRNIALLFISLDKLKEIQNTFGHLTGICTLQEVSARLKNHFDENVTIAKFDGDEFALLLTGIQGAEDVIKVIRSLDRTFRRPLVIEGKEIYIQTSVGISLFPGDGETAQTLLRNAGAALSRAKEKGGNNYQFYTADMNECAVKRLTLENDLRRALERGEFEVFYQPKIDVKTERIVGAEALVRWRHPEKGLVAPVEFIPLAEETGLILPIGEYVLRNACLQSKAWRDEGFVLDVSVNLSARQFEQPELLEIITGIIRETGIEPCCLNLEITESSIMKNADSAVETLCELKKIGIKISLDDFGTGYSSFDQLKRLPIDVIKIDRSFVRDVADADDAALVAAIINLAHNLRLKVVDEGVETEDQLDFLRRRECDQWQGYLCSKPVPPESFQQLLDRRSI